MRSQLTNYGFNLMLEQTGHDQTPQPPYVRCMSRRAHGRQRAHCLRPLAAGAACAVLLSSFGLTKEIKRASQQGACVALPRLSRNTTKPPGQQAHECVLPHSKSCASGGRPLRRSTVTPDNTGREWRPTAGAHAGHPALCVRTSPMCFASRLSAPLTAQQISDRHDRVAKLICMTIVCDTFPATWSLRVPRWYLHVQQSPSPRHSVTLKQTGLGWRRSGIRKIASQTPVSPLPSRCDNDPRAAAARYPSSRIMLSHGGRTDPCCWLFRDRPCVPLHALTNGHAAGTSSCSGNTPQQLLSTSPSTASYSMCSCERAHSRYRKTDAAPAAACGCDSTSLQLVPKPLPMLAQDHMQSGQ